MKAVAHSYFWWFGLDKDIENLGKSCENCAAAKSNPTVVPLHCWVRPDVPWTSIHVDFAGLFLGKMFFVVVDAHSTCKCPEVLVMNSSTSQSTIEALRSVLDVMDCQHSWFQIKAHNSNDFVHFLRSNGVKHIGSACYHPLSYT